MPRNIFTGSADFVEIRNAGSFYVDKTSFIRDWWDGDGPDGASKITLVTRCLKEKRLDCWWANTSSNDLIDGLVRRGKARLKSDMMPLLQGRYRVTSTPVQAREEVAHMGVCTLFGLNFTFLQPRSAGE